MSIQELSRRHLRIIKQFPRDEDWRTMSDIRAHAAKTLKVSQLGGFHRLYNLLRKGRKLGLIEHKLASTWVRQKYPMHKGYWRLSEAATKELENL